MAQFPSESEVLDAVEKAGWLLEQQAVRVLERRGFNPRPSWAFKDPDEPTSSREIDVWSYRRYFNDSDSKVTVAASILVECKQSEMPYCAIGHHLPEWRQKGNPNEHTLPVEFLPADFDPTDASVLRYGYLWDVTGFRDATLEHGQTNFRATQLTRLDHNGKKWSATNAGIFNSLVYPLAKAIHASKRGDRPQHSWPLPNSPYFMKERQNRWSRYVLRFPVVLISSPLYVIDASGDTTAFSHEKWVRVQRHLESESVNGLFEFDVVNKDAFIEYIEGVVEGLTLHVASAVEANPLRYTGEQWISIEQLPEGQLRSTFPPASVGSAHRRT